MHDPLETTSTTAPAQSGCTRAERCRASIDCPCTQGGPCLCAASKDGMRLSVPKCALALLLVGAVGSFVMLKPDPNGVRAGDLTTSQVPEDQLRAVVLKQHEQTNQPTPSPRTQGSWLPLGSLVGQNLSILIEARDTDFAYTVTDSGGNTLATRATREELQSLLPQLDIDSLTASPSQPRLMLADDRGDR